jgi:hypothetical protein
MLLIHLQIWELSCAADGTPGVRHAANLEGHNATVNCVRFSKTGAACCFVIQVTRNPQHVSSVDIFLKRMQALRSS